jgi:hypothetical protein
MSEQPQLHFSLVAMILLAARTASGHPAMGQCQLLNPIVIDRGDIP